MKEKKYRHNAQGNSKDDVPFKWHYWHWIALALASKKQMI
jgi:hypothetical protein